MLMNKSSASRRSPDLPRLSQLRTRDQCRVCAGAAPHDIAAVLDPAQFAGAASSL